MSDAEERFEAWQRAGYFPSLDGIRCLSIVPVIWHHATPRPLDGVLGRGPLGVDLFFALSGFLITTLLVRERAHSGTVRVGAFYARRALRIFPFYYLVLLAFVLHALFLREHGPIREHFLRSLPFHATFTSNWFVDGSVPHPIVFAFGWSLAVEEQFYAVWPWLMRARQRAWPVLLMVLLLLVDQAAERGYVPVADGLLLRLLRSLSTPIVLGALLALSLGTRSVFAVFVRVLRSHVTAPAALAVVVLGAVFAAPLLLVHVGMAVLVGACAIRPDHLLVAIFEQRIVRHVGAVSYGMYLVHVPILQAVKKLGPSLPTPSIFAAGLVLSVLVATLLHRVIDARVRRVRERFVTGGHRTAS